ncbi:MAG: class I SAM-dependent methyltransferase [Candidatus Wallbacteria bacterium]|nr:class I SAM-dependent methyltransferase [Candidatus Wallbacteria bacterium]
MNRAAVLAYRRLQDYVLPERVMVRAFIARHLPAQAHADAKLGLDLGAGTAPFARALEQAWPGLRMVAVDVVADDTAHVVADAESLPFANGTADLVSAFHLLQHVPDPRRMLSEVRRVLRPGGVLLVTFPFLGEAGRSRDLWRWTRLGMQTELGRAGFTVVADEVRGGPLLLAASLAAGIPGRLLIAHRRGWRSGREPMDVLRLALAFALALPFHLLGFAMAAIDRLLSRDPAHHIGGTMLARRSGDD